MTRPTRTSSRSGVSPKPTQPFDRFLGKCAGRVERVLDRRLRPGRGPGKLVNAMRYALFGGGKRLRPALVYLGCEAFGGDPRAVDGAAAAVEMIHTYSLVHDDLPCMDDDDLRRGRPTLHVKFDEATAVLAGDALHTEAFATLAELSEASLAPALVRTLAFAAGLEGMVGGQILDLAAEGRSPSAPIVEAIHRGKSAALIAASLEMGAIGARARAADLRRIREYGMIVGLAFQVADDVLDVVGDAATLGKTPGKDAKAGKMSYPAAVGLERSRARARELASRAVRLAESLGGPALPLLVALPTFVTDRSK